MSVSFLDSFYLVNQWKPDSNFVNKRGISYYLIDESTGRRYLNESKKIVRIKCAVLLIVTPLLQTSTLIANAVYRTFKVALGVHFWCGRFNKGLSFRDQTKEFGCDLFRVIATPIALIALQFSALYGLIIPYDGRKLYSSIERVIYAKQYRLAKCFSPISKMGYANQIIETSSRNFYTLEEKGNPTNQEIQQVVEIKKLVDRFFNQSAYFGDADGERLVERLGEWVAAHPLADVVVD